MSTTAEWIRRCAVGLALTAPASLAAAQDVDDVLDDVAAFRDALGASLHLNLSCDDGSVHAAASADSAGIRWRDGAWSLDDTSLSWPARMVALALATADVPDSAAALGVPVVEQWLSYETLYEPDGTAVVVRRLGSARFNVAVEPGIARPREWRVTLDGTRYTARVEQMLDVASGWYPATVTVLVDDDAVMRCTVLDAARSASALAPMSAPAGSAPTAAPSIPRLPL